MIHHVLLKLALVAALFQVGADARADIENSSKVLSRSQHVLEVELNAQTVLCSRADYAGEFLKILIPQLAELTFLDHRNRGAGAPCVGAGACRSDWQDGHLPGDILDEARPRETIALTIELVRNTSLDREAKKCTVSLKEEIKTNVRGVDFYHARYASLGERHFEDCL